MNNRVNLNGADKDAIANADAAAGIAKRNRTAVGRENESGTERKREAFYSKTE